MRMMRAGGPYRRSARRKLTRRLLAGDVCTSPVSEAPLLVQKAAHVLVSEDACAPSSTITLHVLLIEKRYILFPGHARASYGRDVWRIFFRRVTSHRKRICLACPDHQAARLRPARAASENLISHRDVVKMFMT